MLLSRIERLLDEVVRAHALAGLAVGVVTGGRTGEAPHLAARGLQRIGAAAPMTARSLFNVASVTKPFVAAAVLQLREAGKVDLDAPVSAYLPYFRAGSPGGDTVTVRHLLCHTSGLPRDGGGAPPVGEQSDGLEWGVRRLAGARLNFRPGERFAYSNLDYLVLGDLVAKVSGTAFESYVHTRVLEPLGMGGSTFRRHAVPAGLLAAPHLNVPEPVVSPDSGVPDPAVSPGGGLYASAEGLSHFARMCLNRGTYRGRRLLGEDSCALMERPQVPMDANDPARASALGWLLGTHRGLRTVHHPGSAHGYGARIVLLPERSLGVVVLTNSSPAPTDAIADAVLDAALGHEPLPPKPLVVLPLCRTLFERGLDAALAQYRALRGAQPQSYDFSPGQYYHVADTYLEVLRQPAKAVACFRLAAAIHPDRYHYVLAEALVANGQPDLAVGALISCLELDPQHPNAPRLLQRLRSQGATQAGTRSAAAPRT